MNLKRPMFCPSDSRGPTVGLDVEIAKTGLYRLDAGLPKPAAGFSRTFGKQMEESVRQIQQQNSINRTGNIGTETWERIWPALNAYNRWRYSRFTIPKTFEERAWEKLIAAVIELDAHTPGYLLGGGHGVPLSQVSAYQRLDCSSSTSKVLFEAGIFEHDYAIVSGQFETWSEPGPGKWFTVYANHEHVWTRLHSSKWWRFDTSPHGDGGRGPQLRYLPRFTSGFVSRHYPGM